MNFGSVLIQYHKKIKNKLEYFHAFLHVYIITKFKVIGTNTLVSSVSFSWFVGKKKKKKTEVYAASVRRLSTEKEKMENDI